MKYGFDKFHRRWIYAVILLVAGCTGCANWGDEKPNLVQVITAVKDACDGTVLKIEFDNTSTEEPRVKSGICQQVIKVQP